MKNIIYFMGLVGLSLYFGLVPSILFVGVARVADFLVSYNPTFE